MQNKGECITNHLNRDEVFRKSLYSLSDIFDGEFFSPEMFMKLEDNDSPIQVSYKICSLSTPFNG